MFGKIRNFKVNENIVKVEFENIEAKINIISPIIINFFVPNYRDEQNSKAIENLKIQHCRYEVDRYIDNITIKTDELIIIYMMNLKLIYTIKMKN